jgi:hypothetical protein
MGVHEDLDALQAIAPEELAAKLTDPALRRQLVRGMVIVSFIDGEASPKESALVEAFAQALGVSTPDLKALRHLANKQLLLARVDIMRRFFGAEKLKEFTREKGFGWLASTIAAATGLREDTAMANRYRALGDCAPGTLGREYFELVKRSNFPFPGEKHAPFEFVVFHDLAHVLSGYGTDPKGELQVAAFHAGCRREEKDPFAFLLFAITYFHLGIALAPTAPATKMQLEPAKMFTALQRGAACKIDPTDGWDPWPVMDRPVEALRTEYNIPPLT